MALRLLDSWTDEWTVSQARTEAVVGQSPKSRVVRFLSDVMCFVYVRTEDKLNIVPEERGYPVPDLVEKEIEIPGGHYLVVYAEEDGKVWVTEAAHG